MDSEIRRNIGAPSILILGLSLCDASTVPTILAPTQPFTVFRVVIQSPNGDPIAAGSPANQFTLATASGTVSIQMQAAVIPSQVTDQVQDLIRWTITPLPAETEISWNSAWPGDLSSGLGLNPIATLTGYPSSNDGFGVKTVSLQVVRNGQVIFSTATQIALFFEKDGHPSSRTDPNWFYYWQQTTAGEANAMYVPSLPFAGYTPAGGSWITYTGPRRRIQIGPAASTIDIRHDGSNETIKSLGLFCNVVRHENRHVQQVFDNNAVAFYSGQTGALRDAVCAGWSFTVSSGSAVSCGGNLIQPWNHFTDQNGNAVYDSGDARLDANFDDLADTLEPSAADLASCTNKLPIQCQAQMAETCTDASVQDQDWSDHGLQHYFLP